MNFKVYVHDFVDCLIVMKDTIRDQKDYITELDAATGDGDHWANLYMGFEKVCSMEAELKSLSFPAMLKKVGMCMLSSIGGSSGALYGSGYMAAAKAIPDSGHVDVNGLYTLLDAMLKAIMDRGKAQPGQKTMIDSLYVALLRYRKALDNQQDNVISSFIEGAKEGADQTREMEAVKGRASYRVDKGVGYLDPGAVTMSIQLECLGKYILHKVGGN